VYEMSEGSILAYTEVVCYEKQFIILKCNVIHYARKLGQWILHRRIVLLSPEMSIGCQPNARVKTSLSIQHIFKFLNT